MQPPVNAAREELRAQLVSRIPPTYSPSKHLLIPSTIGLLGITAVLCLVHNLRLVELWTIPVTLLGGLGLEWRAHKDLLHQRRRGLEILNDRHERLHHVVFTHDDMGLRGQHEMALVLLPTFAIVPLLGMLLPLGLLLSQLAPRNCALLAVATSLAFFLLYEWLHLAYHLPPDTFIGRNPLIAGLRSLHQRHHDPRLMRRWNFNVTIPVFDWLHRTRWSAERAARVEPRLPAASAARHESSDSPSHS